ncbi:branched-chain amino acid ABC transporter permease [Hoeflea sp. WL0058]|uniref:Branched-chain amino acid ABC transporter permease n=1 Tax=Flavimaribacter sediminis TaxID=2865987 RepID=A0AAE2ZL80_9HYPH|nr:branched-chain amino acid ABC transporter permease [Flavimaribacter sediminis]MBW8636343.1 branched-chain amino acid ABC transporter permease [Flavimaribacter sediminis]
MTMLLVHLLVDGIVTGCSIGLVAATFAYFYSATGTFHVAHAGIYTFCCYVAWYCIGLDIPFVPALLIAMIVGALLGMMIQGLLYAKLERLKATPLVMLIGSIGVLTVLQNVSAILFSPNIIQFDLPWRTEYLEFGPILLSIPQLLIVILCPLLFLALQVFSSRTALGRQIRAVASNPELAQITHLRPQRMFLYAIAISSALVAVPGTLVGIDQAMQPYTSLIILLTAVVAVIAGGIGSLAGAFLMSIVLSIIQSVSVLFVSGRWSLGVVFAIFILFILLRPEGLVKRKFKREL